MKCTYIELLVTYVVVIIQPFASTVRHCPPKSGNMVTVIVISYVLYDASLHSSPINISCLIRCLSSTCADIYVAVESIYKSIEIVFWFDFTNLDDATSNGYPVENCKFRLYLSHRLVLIKY